MMWTANEVEDQGFVGIADGHIERTDAMVAKAVEFMARELGEPVEGVAADFAKAGVWSCTWRGDDPTGEYGWLVCDASGASGFTHDCWEACIVPAHLDEDGDHRDEDVDVDDCRCDRPECEGYGSEIMATNVRPVTIVSIDSEKLWRIEREELHAKHQAMLAVNASGTPAPRGAR